VEGASSSKARTSAIAASQRLRIPLSSYRRALSIAIPAAPASAVSTASSSAVNSPCRFSVM
jgi:hypothetical protein